MKLKPGFMLREVAGSFIIVAIGEDAVDFNGIITVNEVGAFIWRRLEAGDDKEKTVKALLEEYDVDEETAAADVNEFIEKMQKSGLLS